ncbi:MAG: hypothetical protein J3K34DRAFT_45565 [Monoraphidium minutum]|nr:MAG: hypothetical protein J3K34DRAFT_45565 [Monoraphidium minutum]
MSFDAEEELDADLAAELARVRKPDAWRALQRQLDLAWNIRKSRGTRAPCSCCTGSGESECRWCHGTGAMMAGDTFLRSEDGSSHCPVCKGKGYVACENCRGTGYRATWLGGDQASAP